MVKVREQENRRSQGIGEVRVREQEEIRVS